MGVGRRECVFCGSWIWFGGMRRPTVYLYNLELWARWVGLAGLDPKQSRQSINEPLT